MNSSRAPFYHPGFSGHIGVARTDITPPIGIYARNWGAAKHDAAESINRPLTLTALTLQTSPDAQPLVLVAADMGWWRDSAEASVREPILDALKIGRERFIFNLSHTHSAPVLSPGVTNAAGVQFSEAYLQRIRDAALEAVRGALRSARPATLEWATGRCDLARNRDLPEPEKKRIVCGYNPGSDADDTLLIGRVTSMIDGRERILATLVNYACHPVTLAWENRAISPDFVGAMREIIEGRTEAPCLFLQGASGELAPAEEYTGDTQVADRHGRRLGFAALSVIEGMLPSAAELAYGGVVESGAPLAVWTRRPHTLNTTLGAMRATTAYAIKKDYPPAAEIEQQLAACSDRVMSERMRRKLALRQKLGDGATAESALWAWRIGDVFMLGVPNEAYSLLQTELRRRLAPRMVAVMNLVNGSTAYLPPATLYDTDIYQVWQTPFDRGCLEQTIELGARCVEELS